MMIHFRCPQGHKLKANAFLVGQTVACPACHTHVVVPGRSGEPLTDSAVVRLLDVLPKPTTAASDGEMKHCPACHATIPVSFRICPHCDEQLAQVG